MVQRYGADCPLAQAARLFRRERGSQARLPPEKATPPAANQSHAAGKSARKPQKPWEVSHRGMRSRRAESNPIGPSAIKALVPQEARRTAHANPAVDLEITDHGFYLGVEQIVRAVLMGRNALGEFEQAVMLAILRLGPNAYGVPIRRDLSERLRRTVSVGAVYTALERLEGKGFVSSWTCGATAERGGRAKRFYRVEAPGLRALDAARVTTEKLWTGLPEGAFA
jgi:PadR family transcriptional regulator PadR